MMDAIEKLLILQDRDRKLSRVKDELAHMEPERQSLQGKASRTQAGLEAAKAKVMHLESERKQLEIEVDTFKQKIEKYSVQQFQTKKNEEFRAIGHEIQNAKNEIFKIEDHQLDLMEKIESGQKEVVAASKAAADAKKLVDDQLALLAAKEGNLQQELAALTSNREQLAAAVDESARARYERLWKSKGGGTVVVGIQHGVCGGCHMRIPAQITVSCKREEEIVTCPNCARILYYTSDMNLAVAE